LAHEGGQLSTTDLFPQTRSLAVYGRKDPATREKGVGQGARLEE